jgi:hypothetical protein
MLGQHLVRRTNAGQDAGAGVGHAEYLEQLLDGAILAVAAVHRDERHLGPRLAQAADEVQSNVDRHGLVPEPPQRVLHASARAQRHLALEGAAPLQDRHPGQRARLSRSPRVGIRTT